MIQTQTCLLWTTEYDASASWLYCCTSIRPGQSPTCFRPTSTLFVFATYSAMPRVTVCTQVEVWVWMCVGEVARVPWRVNVTMCAQVCVQENVLGCAYARRCVCGCVGVGEAGVVRVCHCAWEWREWLCVFKCLCENFLKMFLEKWVAREKESLRQREREPGAWFATEEPW